LESLVTPSLRVWGLPLGPLETNCWVLACRATARALVVDCGDEPSDVLRLAEAESLSIIGFVATHWHADHIGGMAELQRVTRAPLSIHEADADEAARKQIAAIVFLGRIPEPVRPGRMLRDGDPVTVGEVALRVLHTPGHTKGGVCLVGGGVLISGDTLFAGSVGRADLPGGDWDELQRSLLEVLVPLDPELIVLPGHGPSTTLGTELVTNPYLSGAHQPKRSPSPPP